MSQDPQRVNHPRVKFVGGPIPSFGYGFLINDDNRQHFARYAQEVLGMSDIPPDEAERFRESFAACANTLLPTYVFHARPNMVPVRSQLTLVYDGDDGFEDLFILCDNGSPATKDVPILKEDLDFIRQLLGIPPTTQPKWYEIYRGAWSNFAV